MTTMDNIRGLILLGYVAARLVDGNWKLALFDMAVGIGLMAVMHWIEESRYSPLKN